MAAAVLLVVSTVAARPAWAAPPVDKPGGRDHPLVGRFEGSVLRNFGGSPADQVELPLGRYENQPGGAMSPVRSRVVEGKLSNFVYWGPKGRSELEVYRNFEASLKRSGFSVLYACDEPARCMADGLGRFASTWTDRAGTFAGGSDPTSRFEASNGNYPPRFLVAQRSRPEGDVYVSLTVQPPSSTQTGAGAGAPHFVQVVEAQPMRTDAVVLPAADMQRALTAEGRVALYGVQFDTGSATIKPASQPQLEQMARLLETAPALKVFIVGHTDNVGDFNANLQLSQRRAEAVAAALAQQHRVDAGRMLARGVANLAPVATNGGDAGRARNRRVELVAR